MNWISIEERLPDFNENVLGYSLGNITVVYRYNYKAWNGAEYQCWELAEPGSYAEDGEWTPTHWMPLPEPPNNL